MSNETSMAWEFSRDGGWKEVKLPIILGAEGDCTDLYGALGALGYRKVEDAHDDFSMMAPTIFKNDDRSAVYEYVVWANDGADGIAEFVCKDLPDLIELCAKLQPLWQMSYAYTPKEVRLTFRLF